MRYEKKNKNDMQNTTSKTSCKTWSKARAAVLAGLLTISLTACGTAGTQKTGDQSVSETSIVVNNTAASESAASTSSTVKTNDSVVSAVATMTSDGVLDTSDLFTERDLTQTADLSDASTITVQSGQDVNITEEGVYVLTGNATNATIRVDADSNAKVQLVLDGLSITNDDSPAIYVVSADKVFVTTTQGSVNNLSVTGKFTADGDTNTDAVIFSKDDLVLNGLGSLNITSTDNGMSSHDDLKITGGTYEILCTSDGLEANDNILIADGTIVVTSDKDGIHAENDEDSTTGNVYVAGGDIQISAARDGIQGTTAVQIDGGTMQISSREGIECTYVQINGGDVTIEASDDGINASAKSNAYTPTIEIRGGNLQVTMAAGDTDALDANGNLYISGGTVNISAQFAFDFDGEGKLDGGTVYVNGEQVTELQNSMMGGPGGGAGGFGGPGGDFGGERGSFGGAMNM